LTVPLLDIDPPLWTDGDQVTREWLDSLNLDKSGFLWPDEVRVLEHMLKKNERALTFNESEKGWFRDDYFSPYKMATIPHIPWQEHQWPVPAAIREQVIENIKEKIRNSTYEPSQSVMDRIRIRLDFVTFPVREGLLTWKDRKENLVRMSEELSYSKYVQVIYYFA
jgi:hypothetical protein